MDVLVTGRLTTLTNAGPVGAFLAALLVGLGLMVIVYARTKDLWTDTKGRTQGVEFQDRLLKLVDTLTASEAALRLRIDDVLRDNGTLRDDVDALRADLALVRNQRRRLIEMLRAMRSDHPLTHADWAT